MWLHDTSLWSFLTNYVVDLRIIFYLFHVLNDAIYVVYFLHKYFKDDENILFLLE